MTLSDKIKAVREELRLSQAEMSRRMEIEPPSYHRLENRGDKLTIEQLQKMADALGVPSEYILNHGNKKTYDLEKQARIDGMRNKAKVILSLQEHDRESPGIVAEPENSESDLLERLDTLGKINKYQEEHLAILKLIVNQLIKQIEKQLILKAEPSLRATDISKQDHIAQIQKIRNQMLAEYPILRNAIELGLLTDRTGEGHWEIL